MYGAVVERGIIRAADQKKYIVETLDRKGIESLQITALNGAPFAVGDIVYFFLFPDGTGKIICSEAANDTTGFVVDANYVHTDNNYTDDEKAKLSDIEAEAQKNVQSDWNAESGDAFIKNKPTIPTKVSELENDSKFVDSDGAAAAAPVTTVNDKKGDVKLGKSDVGLGSVTNERQYSAENPPPYPVTKVNNKTGDVSLGKSDVGLGSVANERQYSAENPPPYPVTKVNNKTGNVSLGKSDVGLGNVENVKQYSSSNPPPYPVTKVNNKTGAVTLGKSDVGLGNVDNAKQYSSSNPPPYPVTKVNGTTGDVTTHLVETVGVTFSSGRATVAAKSGYYLVNAYANNRPTSETANQYSIASIQRLTNGQYYLRNVDSGLSASLNVVLIWVKG